MLRSYTHATLPAVANNLRVNQTRPLTNHDTPINSHFSSISALNPQQLPHLKSKDITLFFQSLPNAPVLT